MIGGHAIFCHELSLRQAERGHRIEVFTTLRNDLPRHQLVNERYSITRLRNVWMPWDSLGMSNPVIPSLYSAVGRQKWDIIDAHSHLFWTTAISVKAAIDSGRPIITTVHGFFALRDWLTNLSERLYLFSVGRWTLRNSSRVICLTRSDADKVAGMGVRKRKIRIIPIAVDPNAFTPIMNKREVVLWAGRLVPEKGLDTLLEAVAILHKKRQVHVIIVGDGPLRNKLIGRAKELGISDLITFRFNAARSEVAELFRQSEIFILPSMGEGLPMSLLEAMASSNMIVASRIPSMEEILGDAGLYFTPGEPSELADVLFDALEEREIRRRKGKLAREIVQEKFSWDVVLPMLNDLYQEVLTQ
jgi:glycosyltransferase involved in cell wall biosynthesis